MWCSLVDKKIMCSGGGGSHYRLHRSNKNMKKYIVSAIDDVYGINIVACPVDEPTEIEESVYLSEVNNISEAVAYLRERLGIKKFTENTVERDMKLI
ncbi:MAG TPA: hypothetical protein ENJ27_02290 [Candidatus Moranbacteria bacterium]|nr:hypothetical protein [Candidatus Moranbacteria bacterium]